MRRKIQIGDIFGSLTVISEAGHVDQKSEIRKAFMVRCECGRTVMKINRYLTRPEYPTCETDCPFRRNRKKKC